MLLATRISALLALVVAFAQPFLENDPFRNIGHAQSTIYCWIDPTISMNYRIHGSPLWEHSSRLIKVLDTVSTQTSDILIYERQRGDFVDAQSDPALQPRHGPGDFASMFNRYKQLLENERGPTALFLFTDFQARHTALIDSLLAADTLHHPVLLVSLAPEQKVLRNAGIAYPTVSDELQCSVYTAGAALRSAELQVMSDNMRIGLKQVNLEADSGIIERIPLQSQQQAAGVLQLEYEDFFQEDNRLYFSRSSDQSRRVLVIGDQSQTLPLRTALKLLVKTDISVKAPHAVGFEDLDSAEIIVLSGVRSAVRPLQALLSSGSLREKLILVSPAVQPDAGQWMETVYAHLGSQSTPSVRHAGAQHPVLPDTVSALWRSFPRFEDRTVQITGYLDNLPGTAVMLLNNRRSLISWKRDEQGHVWLLWSTPLEITRDNNFAETGFFIPMLDRMLVFGLNRLSPHDQAWIAGESRYNPYLGLSAGANVYSSDGRLVARWDNQPRISFATPGIYSIHPDGSPTRQIAVNADPHEFDLRYRLPAKPEHNSRFIKSVNMQQFRPFIVSRSASLPSMLFWFILAGALLLETLLWSSNRKTESGAV